MMAPLEKTKLSARTCFTKVCPAFSITGVFEPVIDQSACLKGEKLLLCCLVSFCAPH